MSTVTSKGSPRRTSPFEARAVAASGADQSPVLVGLGVGGGALAETVG